MTFPRRTYLDNAATSWPKPPCVYEAVDAWMRDNGAAAGRGVYAQAAESERIVANARAGLARLIGAESPDRIVFCHNGTDSLNLAIHGLLRPGDHVVATVWEHNSVLRPLRACQERLGVDVTLVGKNGGPGRPKRSAVDPAEVEAAVRSNTRLIVLTHASNVTGVVQPAREIGEIARRRGVLFLLDAAQTAGDIPLDVGDLHVDLLAAPGHKGLLGPLGTGLLYLRPGIDSQIAPIRQGGTGTLSESDRQPDFLPDKLESGNLNVPGLAGLAAAGEFLAQQGIETIAGRVAGLTQRLIEGLRQIGGVAVHLPAECVPRVGVVSVTLSGFDPQEAALALDTSFGVQARAGLHCAPAAHRALDTLHAGGTVRFSLGPFTTAEEIAHTLGAVAELVAA